MRVFLTVGSTHFDLLVQRTLSEDVLTTLKSRGYSTLIVQCGATQLDLRSLSIAAHSLDIHIEFWSFKPSLQDEFQAADLVMSHAGSGTILDVLRLGKPLIVVPNPTLLHNHQDDLAVALGALGHLKAATVSSLAQTIREFDPALIVSFPPFDDRRFSSLLDEEMGFV